MKEIVRACELTTPCGDLSGPLHHHEVGGGRRLAALPVIREPRLQEGDVAAECARGVPCAEKILGALSARLEVLYRLNRRQDSPLVPGEAITK